MKNLILIVMAGLFILSCNQTDKLSAQNDDQQKTVGTSTKSNTIVKSKNNTPVEKITKSKEEWKKELSDQEYYVLREKGTERAGTGDLLKNKKDGVYICRGCGLELFKSDTKFESGTGWPSFYAPYNDVNVGENVDNTHGMRRVEVVCARCDGHLGHVFPDGPKPSGMRYCINAISLDFEEKP